MSYKYIEDFTFRNLYHVFIEGFLTKSLCNQLEIKESEVKYLLNEPPANRNKCCEECAIVKEMTDYYGQTCEKCFNLKKNDDNNICEKCREDIDDDLNGELSDLEK